MGKYFSDACSPGGPGSTFSRPGAHVAAGLVVLTIVLAPAMGAADVTESMWRDLVEANAQLRATVADQQRQLATLRTRVEQLEQTSTRRDAVVTDLRDRIAATPASAVAERAPANQKLRLSGDASAAFFAGQRDNQFPNDEFRIDEATLRLEAEAARDVYLYGELQLTTRETRDESPHLGEFYLEFEDVGGTSTPPRLFNVRLGRVDVPFGEEYQRRDALDDPLITHTVSDVWGTDEGIEVFGEAGRLSYAVAVQNGSRSRLRDFNADKSIAGRICFNPAPHAHLSASAMRTGELDAADDMFSEIWIGNVLFRPVGSNGATRFHAELGEVDATWSWDGGHLAATIGGARYDDNDPLADNHRNFTYYQLEAVQNWSPRLYLAARYSRLRVPNGYPYAGLGNIVEYTTGPWTTDLWRLSLGSGYRLNPDVLFKLEYALEQGELRNGTARGDSDLFAAEAVLGF